jgi:hypothetical protein
MTVQLMIILPQYFMSSNYQKCCTFKLIIITTCHSSKASSSQQTELPNDDSPDNDNLPLYFMSSNYLKCCTFVLLIIPTCPFSDAFSSYETPSKQNSPLMTVQPMAISCTSLPENSLLMAGRAILPHYMMNVVDNANPLVADTVCKEEYKWVILWQYTFFSSYSTSEDWLF